MGMPVSNTIWSGRRPLTDTGGHDVFAPVLERDRHRIPPGREPQFLARAEAVRALSARVVGRRGCTEDEEEGNEDTRRAHGISG